MASLHFGVVCLHAVLDVDTASLHTHLHTLASKCGSNSPAITQGFDCCAGRRAGADATDSEGEEGCTAWQLEGAGLCHHQVSPCLRALGGPHRPQAAICHLHGQVQGDFLPSVHSSCLSHPACLTQPISPSLSHSAYLTQPTSLSLSHAAYLTQPISPSLSNSAYLTQPISLSLLFCCLSRSKDASFPTAKVCQVHSFAGGTPARSLLVAACAALDLILAYSTAALSPKALFKHPREAKQREMEYFLYLWFLLYGVSWVV